MILPAIFLALTSALAADDMPLTPVHASTLNPTQGTPVKVVSVRSTVKTEAHMRTTMHVEAVATFVNDCYAPANDKELVVFSETARDNVTHKVTLLQLARDRACYNTYAPVEKTIVVDDIVVADGQPAPLILPAYVVNGVKATTGN